MYAVEFEAQIQNGVVNIPKEYSDIYQRKAKVLVLVDDVEKRNHKNKVIFGILASKFDIPDDFDKPLPEDVGNDFYQNDL
jgi:hypothetical protein